MRNEEIRQKIDGFPNWHFAFDLKGNRTRKKGNYRQAWRKEYFFDPLVELVGGSLEGKRVLDIACNAGFWSLCSVEAGCDYVLGIDFQQMHVEQAKFVFEVKEVDESRYDFIAGDIFATDLASFGDFEVVLCPGLMYHVNKPMELMEKVSALNSDLLLIDTRLSDLPGSAISIRHGGLKMHPTREAMRDMAQQCGYSVSVLKPNFGERGGAEHPRARRLGDYHWPGRRGRRAFVCAKKTDLGRLPAETEPIVLPQPRGQKRRPETGEADAAKLLLERADHLLSRLFSSRRWKLAHAIGTASQLLRRPRDWAPDDRLRELMGEIRALQQRSDRARSARPPKRGSRTN